MASGPHTFSICTVFSPDKHKGNLLAVVAVRGNALSQEKKSLIAKEFGYSETIFIHDAPAPDQPRKVDIFIENGDEIPFAGHPIIGVTHYIFSQCEPLVLEPSQVNRNHRQTAVLMSKAGPIPVSYNPHRKVAACTVPQNFHIHKDRLDLERVLKVQPQIRITPTIDNLKDQTHAVVSIVKGMTFGLINLTSAPDVLAGLTKGQAPDVSLEPEWSPSFPGCLYYVRKGSNHQEGEPTIHAVQARMITQGIEDPGTGSACSALSCYLAMQEDTGYDSSAHYSTDEQDLVKSTEQVSLGPSSTSKAASIFRHVYAIQQGIEMGRPCTIAVEVDIKVEADGRKSIMNVTLSGRCNFFAKGELIPN